MKDKYEDIEPNHRAIVIVMIVAVVLLIAIVIAWRIMVTNELNAVRNAAIADCTMGEARDYAIHVEKCKSSSKEHPKAAVYICWVYTEEAGLEIVYVRYENGKAEVYG